MDTASGLYQVSWRWVGEELHGSVTVPFDCTAVLLLPDGRERTLIAGTYRF